MLKRAGIDAALLKTLPDAEKDTIGKLPNGEPDGFVVDAGWDRVASKMPVPSPADMGHPRIAPRRTAAATLPDAPSRAIEYQARGLPV